MEAIAGRFGIPDAARDKAYPPPFEHISILTFAASGGWLSFARKASAAPNQAFTETSVNWPVVGELRGVSMKSPVVKRSIVISGHKTSVSLEDAFWSGLKQIASGRRRTLSDMVADIDSKRAHGNLSSAIRLFVLDHYCNMIGTADVEAPRLPGEADQLRSMTGDAA
jgi:predicted DNA-binding ribbon-helix-helix protein